MNPPGENTFDHIPVLLDAVLEYLQPKPGGVYVDATLGGAGHSEEILRRIVPTGRLIGIDQDDQALAAAKERLQPYGDAVRFVHDNFVHLPQILSSLGRPAIDGILFDFGVSSPQLDRPERGFSYHTDAPLDMRMDRRAPVDAAHLVNTLSQKELTRIIRDYGEERWAHRIAERIVTTRQQRPIDSTADLAELIKGAIPAAARRSGPHPARRTFQALRIAVNQELDVISQVLPEAIQALRPGGRLVVISFHSLEDRLVKQTFRRAENPCTCPPELPICQCGEKQSLRVLTRHPIVAETHETEHNPRARSAKLRAAERVLLPREGE